jgi:hypothetical protein
VALDILGPLPETDNGNLYVLVIGDYFSKWVEVLPLPNQTAETVAKAFVDEFVSRFGAPKEIHSDQGRNFESKVFAEVLRLLGVSKTRTTPYNPKSDGMIERFNRTLLNIVSLMLDPVKHQRDWDEQLPYVGLAYRSAVHESTGETPNMLMMGREVSLPIDLMVETLSEDEDEDDDDLVSDFALELRERLRQAHERARKVLHSSSLRQKRNYDRRSHGGGFEEGEFVWLFSHQRKPGITRKLRLPWEGPYLVVQKFSDVHVRIQKSPRAKSKVIHVDRLKPYTGPPLEVWKYSTVPLQEEVQKPTETEETVKDNVIIDPEQPQHSESTFDTAQAPEVTSKRNGTDGKGNGDSVATPPEESEVAQDQEESTVSESDKEHDTDKPPPSVRPVDPDQNSMPTATTAQPRRNPPRNRQLPARYRHN